MPEKHDQGSGADAVVEGARLKRTLATAPSFVTTMSDVHLTVSDEPEDVQVPNALPDLLTICGDEVSGPSYRYKKS